MEWYVASTKPREDNIARCNLERLGVETFCPQLKQNKIIRRKRQTVVGPLFPGYLFVRFNFDTHYRAVSYAQGVRGLVTFGAVPARVEMETIDSIKSRLEDGCLTIQPPVFLPGQTVRIQEGPLQGLEAIFEREVSGRERAVLLLNALSYQAHVVVDIENVGNC